MNTLSTYFTPIIGFLLTVAFGFWLGKIGKPYNGILFNIHKLVALGTVILASTQVYRVLKLTEPGILLVFSMTAMAICVLALFVSGAVLSIGNVKYKTAKLAHDTALAFLVITEVSSLYLLSRMGL